MLYLGHVRPRRMTHHFHVFSLFTASPINLSAKRLRYVSDGSREDASAEIAQS